MNAEEETEKRRQKLGFTLVEIMIVVAIIGLLASIAIPSFSRARTDSIAQSCRNNLRQMEAAKQMAAMEQAWGETDGPTSLGNPYFRNLCSTFIRGGERPKCPTGAECFYNALNEEATCQSGIGSHVLH